MSYLVVRLDQRLNIIDVEERSTHGLATQLAHEYTDAGDRASVVPKDINEDVVQWYQDIKQKRDLGFIERYGVVPNGARKQGEGARAVGRMIYEPFGGMFEQSHPIDEPLEIPELPEPPKSGRKLMIKRGLSGVAQEVGLRALFATADSQKEEVSREPSDHRIAPSLSSGEVDKKPRKLVVKSGKSN